MMRTHVIHRSRPAVPDGKPAIPGPEDKRGLRPWAAVAIWAVLLGVLVAVDAGFGNDTVVLAISGGAVVLIAAVAAAAWLDQRLRPGRGYFRHPARTGGVFLLAAAVTMAWLGLAFGELMVIIAVVPLAGAIGTEIAARRYMARLEQDARPARCLR